MTTIERTPTAADLACIICRKPGPDLDIDHVINRGAGGSKERDVPANKVPLCRPCHLAKTVGTIKTWVKDGVYHWRKADSDLVFNIPVKISARYGCLIPCDGADDTDGHSLASVQPSAPSQAGEGTPPQGTPLVQIASVPSLVFAGPGPIICTDVGAQPGPAHMNAEGADLSSNAAPLTPSAFSLEDWMEQGRCLRDEGMHLRKLTTEWAFRVGDWWNTGEREWPHESSQMMDELGLSYWQITKFGSVAARVPPENRLSRDKSELLTVEHYRAVANLPPESQPEALEMAIEDEMSASSLKVWVAEKEGATALVAAPESHECPACGAVHRVRAGS